MLKITLISVLTVLTTSEILLPACEPNGYCGQSQCCLINNGTKLCHPLARLGEPCQTHFETITRGCRLITYDLMKDNCFCMSSYKCKEVNGVLNCKTKEKEDAVP